MLPDLLLPLTLIITCGILYMHALSHRLSRYLYALMALLCAISAYR